MESRPLDVTDIQSEILQRDMQTEMVFCVNCKKQVPKMLFCPNCGYPLYIEGKEKPSEGAVEDYAPDIETEIEPQAEAPELPLQTEEETPDSEEPPREVVEEAKIEYMEEPKRQPSFFGRARSFMGFSFEKVDKTDEHKEEEPEDVGVETGPEEPKILEPDVEGGEESSEMKDDWIFSADEPGLTHEAEQVELEALPAYEEPAFEIEVTTDFKIDPKLIEVQGSLFKGLSMKLWLVDLLRKGEVDEEQYVKKSREYEAELEGLSELRRESLDRSKDLEPLYKALREASVSLSELKVKRDLGLISEEEYDVKTPFYEWDIGHLEGFISGRKAEAAFLEDPRRVISADEFLRIKILAEDCLRSVEMGEVRGVSSGTLSAVRESLRETRDFLETFAQI